MTVQILGEPEEVHFTADFAPGGIFVARDKLAAMGTAARVSLEPVNLPPLPGLEAAVAHIEEGGLGRTRGLGLRFRNVTARQNAALHEIYASLRGEAAAPSPLPSPPALATPALATPVHPTANDALARTAIAGAPPAGPARIGLGHVLDGRYRLDALLGEGGMGRVYRAEQVFMKRKVAVKLLGQALAGEPEMAARFQREAQLVSQLDHPNIVRVFDFGKSPEGLLFLVMELMEGEPLAQLIAREKRLAPARAVDLLAQICDALGEAHRLGIVHRDLKPENVIVVKKGAAEVAKVLDFGIARVAGGGRKESTLTQTGIVIGTPRYLSPEQAMALPIDGRADLYSLGVLAFELLAGRPPFDGRTAMEIVTRHIHERPPRLEAVAADLAAWPALCAVVEKALAKEPHQRPGSAAEMASLLRAAVAPAPPPHAPVQAAPLAPPSPAPGLAVAAAAPPDEAPVLEPKPIEDEPLGVEIVEEPDEAAPAAPSKAALDMAAWAAQALSPPPSPSPASPRCAVCGIAPRPGDRFCPSCGAPLAGPAPEAVRATPTVHGFPRLRVPPPLAGRHKLLTALLRHASDSGPSPLRPVLIVGEAGAGKTALAAALLERLGTGWGAIFAADAGAAPYAGLRAAAARLEAARHTPGALTRIEIAILSRLARGNRLPDGAAVPVVAQALVHALASMPRALWVFDDLDRCDAATRAVFETLCARPLPRPGLLLLGLARSPASVKTALKPAALDRLAPEESAALVAGLLGVPRAAAPLAAGLHELGGGVPQRIVDAAHFCAERGLLRKAAAGWTLAAAPPAPPTDAAGMVARWFEAMPALLQKALFLAALGPPTFSPRVLASALGLNEPGPLAEALAVRNLVEHADEGRWTFTRPLYRAAAEQLRPPAEQADLARALDRALRSDRGELERAARAGALGRVLWRAGETARALEAQERSAREALAAEDDAGAAQRLEVLGEWTAAALSEGKLAASEAEAALARTWARAAALTLAAGDPKRAHAILGAALELRPRLADPHAAAEVLLAHGRMERRAGRPREAEAALREAQSLLRDAPHPGLMCLLATELALCADARGDPRASLAALAQAQSTEVAGAELAPWHGEHALRRRLLLRRGAAAAQVGDRAAAEQALDQALRAAREAGDRVLESLVHAARALGYRSAGDVPGARAAAQSALEAAELAGDARGAARRLYDIGKLSLALREGLVAREHFQRCLDLSRALAWEEGVAMALAGLEEAAGGKR